MKKLKYGLGAVIASGLHYLAVYKALGTIFLFNLVEDIMMMKVGESQGITVATILLSFGIALLLWHVLGGRK